MTENVDILRFDNGTEVAYFSPYEMVKGYQYVAIFVNGAEFPFWASRRLGRRHARIAALWIGNGDHVENIPPDNVVYTDDNIKRIRLQRTSDVRDYNSRQRLRAMGSEASKRFLPTNSTSTDTDDTENEQR